MPQIKHIAIATQDADKTARFYIDVFGMKEIDRLDSPNASGYYLSDGNINMAILNFKNDQVTGPEYGQSFSGIHHIGFYVEDIEAQAEKLKQAGGEQLTPTVTPGTGGLFGSGMGHSNAEVKFSGPDGVIIDMSVSGWQTSP